MTFAENHTACSPSHLGPRVCHGAKLKQLLDSDQSSENIDCFPTKTQVVPRFWRFFCSFILKATEILRTWAFEEEITKANAATKAAEVEASEASQLPPMGICWKENRGTSWKRGREMEENGRKTEESPCISWKLNGNAGKLGKKWGNHCGNEEIVGRVGLIAGRFRAWSHFCSNFACWPVSAIRMFPL